MKIQSLAYFVALVEAGSISKAARQLYLSQPSLTKTLHLLEEELGVALVSRSSSGIRLTQAGEKVYIEAKQILEFYDGWKKLGQHSLLKKIDLYTYISFPDFLLPDIVLRLHKENPELTINITVTERPEIFLSRSDREPVLALVMCHSEEDMRELAQVQGNPPVVLMRGAYRCLVNKRHPLANRTSVTMAQLSHYYLILPNLERKDGLTVSRNGFLRDLLAQSPSPQKVEVETVSNVIPLVEKDADSYALSFWPAAQRYKGVQSGQLVGIPIEDDCTQGIFVLCYSKSAYDRHPVVRQLVSQIQQAAQNFCALHPFSSTGENL